ncbi:MAG: VCBS repeat-containing protein, partial [Planctomycetota bacterium]
MGKPGDVKKRLRRLSANVRDPLWWKDQWNSIEPRKRLTYVISTVMIICCVVIYMMVIASWRPVSPNHRLGPADDNFVSTRTPVPAARIENPLTAAMESRNPHEVTSDLLDNQSGLINDYMERILAGEHVSNVSWAGPYLNCSAMDRNQFRSAYSDDRIRVARWKSTGVAPEFEGSQSLASTVLACFEPWLESEKLRVETSFSEFSIVQKTVTAQLTVQIFGRPDFTYGRQATSLWETQWELSDSLEVLTLERVEVRMQEEIVNYVNGGTLFQDCTGGVMQHINFDQLFYGVDFWAKRIPGIDIEGNQGIAVSDVNNDGLDDLYICEPHGLPNQLLLQNADGTVRSAGISMGVDILDESYCALLLDLDNDG